MKVKIYHKYLFGILGLLGTACAKVSTPIGDVSTSFDPVQQSAGVCVDVSLAGVFKWVMALFAF